MPFDFASYPIRASLEVLVFVLLLPAVLFTYHQVLKIEHGQPMAETTASVFAAAVALSGMFPLLALSFLHR